MIKRLKLMALSIGYALTLTLMGGAYSLVPATASALDCTNPTSQAEREQCGACLTEPDQTCDPGDAQSTLRDTIRNIINVVSYLVGAIAVLMIIVGGFRYVTSSGNSEALKNARNTIVYALVGLIVVAFAQVIVHFTLSSVS